MSSSQVPKTTIILPCQDDKECRIHQIAHLLDKSEHIAQENPQYSGLRALLEASYALPTTEFMTQLRIDINVAMVSDGMAKIKYSS